MKICSRCKKDLPLDSFHLDKNGRRSQGRYPYCKDCRRAYYGQKKLPERVPRLCTYCGIEFRPRPWQIQTNTTGRFFCCDEHVKLFKQYNAVTYYHGYRKHILERDEHRCVLCHANATLHVHHIETRGSGGTDEYRNLATLCSSCHIERAHGKEAASVRESLQDYTAGVDRPMFWDEVMRKSKRDHAKIKRAIRLAKRKQWARIRNSPKAEEYREKQRERNRRLQKSHRAERAKDNFRTAKNRSGYRGVSNYRGRWRATIRVKGKDYYIGDFNTKEFAAVAYNQKATELLGDRARLNTIIQADVNTSGNKNRKKTNDKGLCSKCRRLLAARDGLCVQCF